MIARALRTLHAIRHIPPQRHLWRVLRRGQRKLNTALPGPTYTLLQRSGAALPMTPHPLTALAALRLAHEAEVATGWALLPDGRLEVTIHGVSVAILPEQPHRGLPDDLPYLWQMSLGYMGYGLSAAASDDPDARRIFLALAEGFASAQSWAAPRAQDRHWHPYCASHRLINMIAGRSLLEGRAEDLSGLDRAIREATALVARSTERDIHYNHLTKNLLALMVSAAFRTGKIGPRAFAGFARAADRQILPDGGHAELCPMYHAQFLADLLVLRAIPERMFPANAIDWLDRRIAAMRAALHAMSFGDGEIALFGDSWLGEAPPASVLAPGGAPAGIVSLPQTGYTRLEAGQYAVIVDHGRIGPDDNPGHGHDDALSIEVAVAGARLIVDHGVETYTASAARARSRARASHNAPSFATDRGMDAWGAFRVGQRIGAPQWSVRQTGDWLVFSGMRHSLGHGAPTATRTIHVGPDGVILHDRWLATHGAARFLFAAHAGEVTVTALRGALSDAEQARHFPVFGQPEPAFARLLTPENGEAVLAITDASRDPGAIWAEICALSGATAKEYRAW